MRQTFFRSVSRNVAAFALTVSAACAAAQTCPAIFGNEVTPLSTGRAQRAEEWKRILAPIVAGRRVVMLGEPSHGDGNSIAIRSEIVEVLHAHFGFDVLAFEGDFFGLGADWNEGNASVTNQLRENLYAFWSSSPASSSLLSYLERETGSEKPLRVAGFDIRMGGKATRQHLVARLHEVGGHSKVPFNSDAKTALVDLVEDDVQVTASQIQKDALFAFFAGT